MACDQCATFELQIGILKVPSVHVRPKFVLALLFSLLGDTNPVTGDLDTINPERSNINDIAVPRISPLDRSVPNWQVLLRGDQRRQVLKEFDKVHCQMKQVKATMIILSCDMQRVRGAQKRESMDSCAIRLRVVAIFVTTTNLLRPSISSLSSLASTLPAHPIVDFVSAAPHELNSLAPTESAILKTLHHSRTRA